MKNILLVFTGGTIGSSSEHGTIDTSGQARYQLLELFNQHYPHYQQVNFKTLQPVKLLSENLHPSIWKQIIQAIEAEDMSNFDGIIVTHGTDTLAFTAAALSFYFNFLEIPLLLVSSDYPLNHPKANGVDNFICAVDYIFQKQPAGTFVPYKNPGQTMHLHIATRLASSLQLSGDFISVQSKPYMNYKQGLFEPLLSVDRPFRHILTLKPNFSSNILLIRPYPGLDYSHINLDGVDAVLHDLYHSGTACTSGASGNRYSLIEFIRNCRQQQLPFYIAPAVKHPDAYKSTRELIEQGGEMIWNISLESAYAKLLLAYGNYSDLQSIGDFLQQDIALEHI